MGFLRLCRGDTGSVQVMAIYETPEHPAFTDWVVKSGLLHEPLRIVDVGCQGGLHGRWTWLGGMLQAWACDPLPDVIEALRAANPAPSRIHYEALGLGNRDTDRPFMRRTSSWGSYFLPENRSVDECDGDGVWTTLPMRKLDSLMAERAALGRIDHIKLDCEGLEIEVLRGAERFLRESGVFAVESESDLKLNPLHDPCHFVSLYRWLAPYGFDVYDVYFYRWARQPMSGGDPHRGRPDTFDFLFLRGFGTNDDVSTHSIDRLIKMAIVAELYALQDVAADLITRGRTVLSQRLDVARALQLLGVP